MLLRSPRDVWTVRALATATGPDVSASVVRDTIYMLITAAAMSVVPGNRAITVQLTAAGVTQLRSIEKAWQSVRAVRVPTQLTAGQQMRPPVRGERPARSGRHPGARERPDEPAT